MSVQGKTVMVTGASRGIGRAVAEAFAQGGAHVVATGRDSRAMADTEAALRSLGASFEMVCLDVRDEPAVVNCIGGLRRLDVLVNNAGIARSTPLLETTTQEFRDIFDVNVVGAFVVMREAARKMLAQSPAGGHVINIASDAALRGISGMTHYCGSKHALLGMGRAVSQELRCRGLRVTTYCPGPVTTDILGPGTANPNALPPSELAKTILHLADLSETVEVQEALVQPMPVPT